MKKKLVMLFCLSIMISSCSNSLYKEYSFKQKGVRELNIYFINDTLGNFKVNYVCSDKVITIEQYFIYKKTSGGKFIVYGTDNQNHDLFINIPTEKLLNCNNSKTFFGIERVPVIKEEEILIYRNKLFWQKIDNNKIISAFTFKAKKKIMC